eukprot:Opistho-2@22460
MATAARVCAGICVCLSALAVVGCLPLASAASATAFRPLFPESLTWFVEVVDSVSITTLSPLFPHTQHTLHVRVANDGVPDVARTRELALSGGSPSVDVDELESVVDGSFVLVTETDEANAVTGWFFHFKTAKNGELYFTVSGSRIASWYPVADTWVILFVNPFVRRTGPGAYVNLIGSAAASSEIYGATEANVWENAGLSTAIFVVLNSSSNVVYYTDSEFARPPTAIKLANSVLSSPAACAAPYTAFNNGIRAVLATNDRVVVLGPSGIVEGRGTDVAGQDLVWSNSLRACVSSVAVSRQVVVSDRYMVVFAFDAVSPYVVYRAEVRSDNAQPAPFTPLVDRLGRGMGAALSLSALSNSSIVSASESIAGAGVVTFLVDTGAPTGSRYSIVQYAQSTWTLATRLPRTACLRSARFGEDIVRMFEGVEGSPRGSCTTFELVLNNIEFSRTISTDVFLFGNALLYSPDAGLSFYIIREFKDSPIISFASAFDSSYACVTASGEVWFGQADFSELALLQPAQQSGRLFSIFFSYDDSLRFLSISKTNASDLIAQTLDIQSAVDQSALADNAMCPYKELVFDAEKNATFTRRQDSEWQDLPDHIFVDKAWDYGIVLSLTPRDGVSLDDLTATIVAEQTYISVSYERSVSVSSNSVNYTFHITDKAIAREQSFPGENVIPTGVRIFVNGATFACQDSSKKSDIKTAVSSNLVVYSGCPKQQSISFVKGGTVNDHCTPIDGIPCVYFDNEFQPSFVLTDDLTENTSPFTGRYRLRLIGGGETLSSVAEFSEADFYKYNPITERGVGSQPIWSPNANEAAVNDTVTSLTFVCPLGSVCSRVYPRNGNVPEFFFLWEVDTSPTNGDASYCRFKYRFIVRVFGLPMDIITTAYITIGTFGLGIVLVLLGFFFVPLEGADGGFSSESLVGSKGSLLSRLRRRGKVDPAAVTATSSSPIGNMEFMAAWESGGR